MSTSPDREIMTIDEAAQLLGVSVKTFNKVLHTQSIPARKIGREWKFSRQHLINWVGSGRSTDFYRENRSERSNDKENADDQGSLSPKPRSGRRTTGWRLELD